jgi:hypothetical protein
MKFISLRTILPFFCLGMAAPALSDFVLNDDVIIEGQLCAGSLNCVNDETFSGEEVKIKDFNPEILFDDISTNSANDWSLKGDDDTAGASNSFSINNRSTGAIPFAIAPAAPSSALWISGTGDIGMGTTLPQNDLHVVSTFTPEIRLEQAGATFYSWDIAANELNFFLQDVSATTVPLLVEAAAPNYAFIVKSSGDIGLGVSSPEEKLHIRTTAANTDAFALFDAAGTGSDAAFLLRQQGTTPSTWEFRNQQSSGRLNVGLAGGNTPFKIDNAANNNLMRLGRNGLPDEVNITGRLVVNNTQLNVPDYVFAEGYNLRPLAEVAAFINANSHLPDVPSEADIKANGVDMTQMQMTLLKKVEELTLYTLRQDDLIAMQRTEINALHAVRAELHELRDLVHSLQRDAVGIKKN